MNLRIRINHFPESFCWTFSCPCVAPGLCQPASKCPGDVRVRNFSGRAQQSTGKLLLLQQAFNHSIRSNIFPAVCITSITGICGDTQAAEKADFSLCKRAVKRCLHFHDEVHIRLPIDITRGPVLWRRRVVRPKLPSPKEVRSHLLPTSRGFRPHSTRQLRRH